MAEQKLAAGSIVVTFNQPGGAEFNVEVRNVGPVQILMVAEWLRLRAERQLNEQWTLEAASRARNQQDLARVQSALRRS